MPLPQLPPPDAPVLHVHSHTAGQLGPISRRDLKKKLEDGTIPAQSHVWMDGMAGWETLDQHREALLAGLDGGEAAAAAAPAPAPAPASTGAPASDGGAAEAPSGGENGAGAAPAASAPEASTSAAEVAAAPAASDRAPTEGASAATAESAASDGGARSPEGVEPSGGEPVPEPRAGESADDYQDRVFAELVRQSWAYLGEHRFAGHIDEIFVGAVITATLDTGYSLIDLTSDGTHHYLRFENLSDRTRIIVRLTHLTASLAVSKVLGQRMSAVIGYGERIGNIGKIWSALQAEMKSSYIQDAEPGTITVDGDVASGYVYCQVDLYLDIDDYVSRDYSIDYQRLSTHIGAVTHALRKYLRGRFA